ncbi:MAG TPA: hypothetical protein VE978_28300 [Chitinophagales bacterium]|nr:hypothetical protein [Chitinophagales bacterium]
MELLTKLTPAETLFILKPDSLLRDLMKYTMMDLLLQEKLALINFEPKVVQGTSRLGYVGVMIGRKFQQVEPKLHEMIFLFPFYKRPRKRIVFRHLLQMGMSTARSESNFKERLLLDASEMKPLFTKKFFQKIFGGLQLSDEGKKVQEEIVKQFNTYDKILPPLIKSDQEKAREMLRDIKGNILLLNSFRFDLIQMIGKEIAMLEEELETGESALPQ